MARTCTVVISLPDAAERRAAFTERARGSAVSWAWFEAHRELAPPLDYSPDDAIVAKGRPMFPGELGCYSSHYAAWQAFLGNSCQQLLVLEDDTIVDWSFVEKLVAVDLQAAGVRYLRLYAKRPCAYREVLRNAIERQRTLIEYLDRPLGTQGYLMTRAGAELFVRHCRTVRRPLDDELDRSWEHGVPCLGVYPFPLIEQAAASTIEPARFDRFVVPRRLWLRRRAMKLKDRLLQTRQRIRLRFSPRPAALRTLVAR